MHLDVFNNNNNNNNKKWKTKDFLKSRILGFVFHFYICAFLFHFGAKTKLKISQWSITLKNKTNQEENRESIEIETIRKANNLDHLNLFVLPNNIWIFEKMIKIIKNNQKQLNWQIFVPNQIIKTWWKCWNFSFLDFQLVIDLISVLNGNNNRLIDRSIEWWWWWYSQYSTIFELNLNFFFWFRVFKFFFLVSGFQIFFSISSILERLLPANSSYQSLSEISKQ